MNNQFLLLLKGCRKLYRVALRPAAKYGYSYTNAQFSGQQASDIIKERLLSDSAVMICRFGSTELNCVLNHFNQKKSFFSRCAGYINGDLKSFGYDENTPVSMSNLSGFFPADIQLLEKFSELMLEDVKYIDILGSWLIQEAIISKELPNDVVKVQLPDLEPYYHENPWSSALQGKKVLVIHPFEDSINKQYKLRNLLFENENVLPDFELKTIKAIQSLANNETGFRNWFDALEFMKEKITATDFDIAIIGCGAYGLPLAAHVKRIGKKAVHLGGATQILFGIRGKRWEQHEYISKMINKYWVTPLPEEYPQNYNVVEKGCYW